MRGQRSRRATMNGQAAHWRLRVAVLAVIATVLSGCAESRARPDYVIEDWTISQLLDIGEDGITVLGNPERAESPWGDAVAFDGDGDAIFMNDNPLIGRSSFTIEVLMWPDGDGPAAQRYLHFGLPESDRVLLETRVTGDGHWYHDSFVYSGDAGVALIDTSRLHPTDAWYHVALVFDEGAFATYVNGEREIEGRLDFTPQVEGRTSIGVRMNEVYWYKGRFQRIRISDRALAPEEFVSFVAVGN